MTLSPPHSFSRRLRKWLLGAVVSYLGVILLMLFLENMLVYPLKTMADHWEEPPDPVIQNVTFLAANGDSIHGWFLEASSSSEAILICHGNGNNLSRGGKSLMRFREQLGCSALIFDYPGYGKSGGKPTESSCCESAMAALRWLNDVKGIPNERVILFGDSLGSGVAVEAARLAPCRALILSKAFTSLPDVANQWFWWLPVERLMRNRFENLQKMRDIHVPVFIASATHDELVPFEMGTELFEAANEPKVFLALQGEGHKSRLSDDFMIALHRFLERHHDPN